VNEQLLIGLQYPLLLTIYYFPLLSASRVASTLCIATTTYLPVHDLSRTFVLNLNKGDNVFQKVFQFLAKGKYTKRT
jgi:hypothetical protein